MIVIVWNNRGYGEIRKYMVARDITPVGVDPSPDFRSRLARRASRARATVIEIDEPGSHRCSDEHDTRSRVRSAAARATSSTGPAGERRRATLPVIDPSTEAVLAHVSAGGDADVEHAVRASRAFAGWKRTTGATRAALLRDRARRRRTPHAARHLQSLNNGKPFAEAEIDVADVIATFDYYASLAVSTPTAKPRSRCPMPTIARGSGVSRPASPR